MPDTALVVVARYPQPGTTKTRLARSIGHAETARLYRAFLSDLALKFAGREYDLYWAYTPAGVDYAAFMASLVPSYSSHMYYFQQQGADLGERLLTAFRWTHERGYRNSIIIGSDLPHIHPAVVAQARIALEDADVVLGPADDGGYYLIGMRQPYDVFQGISMSTDQVLRMTIELAQRQGLRVSTLETLFDVDELPDLLRLAQLLQLDSSLAPVTAAHLATMKEFA